MRWTSIIAVGSLSLVLVPTTRVRVVVRAGRTFSIHRPVGCCARSDAARTASGGPRRDRHNRRRRDRQPPRRPRSRLQRRQRPHSRALRQRRYRHNRHRRRQLRRSVPRCERSSRDSLSSELAASPFAAQPGTFGSQASLSSGGMPQMIGDLGPLRADERPPESIPAAKTARRARSARGEPGHSGDPRHQDQRGSIAAPARPRVFHVQLLPGGQ